MTSNRKIGKELTSILSNQNNFHTLEVVDRVSETQLQVAENSNWIIWRLKGYGQTQGLNTAEDMIHTLTPTARKYFCINHRDQRIEIIMNVLVRSFRFIWIPMVSVYDHYKYFNYSSAWIDFRRQILTSKVGPELKRLRGTIYIHYTIIWLYIVLQSWCVAYFFTLIG